MASNSDLPDSVWRLLRPTGLAGLGVFVSALAGCSRQMADEVKTPTPKSAARVVAQAEAIPTTTLADYADLATRCVALDEATPTDTARLGIVPATDGQQPASKAKKPVVSAARAPAPPAKKVAQKVEKVETRVAPRQSRPTVRLADPAPVQEPAVQEAPKVEATVAAPVTPVVVPEPAPAIPSPPPPVLSQAPALSIALSNGPAPATTAKAPVLRMAKGRAAPTPAATTPEAAAPVVETAVPAPESAKAPSVAVAPVQESTAPAVDAAPIPEPVVGKQPAPAAVALAESKSAETKNAAPADQVAVPPRQAPAVAKAPAATKNPAASSWQPFTQRVEHWPQPVAPSVGARDTADEIVAAAPNYVSPPVPTRAPAVASVQDSPKAPAVVSAPPRPAVPAASPAAEAMGSRRSSTPPAAVVQKRTPVQNAPAATAQLPMSPPPVWQPVVQSRPVASQTPPVRVAAARPPIAPTTATAAESSQQLAMISNRAGEHIEYAFNLAERGALYSAEAEFTQGLVLVAQALDAQHHTQAHSTAVAAGLRALHEADDFMPRGGQTLVRVEDVVPSHKTPVWNNVRPEQVPPLVAMQRYYAYAQQQFTISGTSAPAAAMALYGLGRLQSALSAEDSVKKMTAGPKAMALYRATLDIDPNNYLAANELGVIYGRYGQLNDAEASLRRSIAIAPRTENLHNLADVLDRMGNSAGATEVRQQELVAKSSGNRPGWQTSADRVPLRYVDPETFMKASAGVDPDQLATAEPAKTSGEGMAAPAAPAADPKTAKKSYGWFGDKLAEGAARVSRPAKSDPEMVR